jgi:hypothetical protein
MRILFTFSLLFLLIGCATRNIHPSLEEPTESLNPSFLNIRAGTRLRVVTPILKSGGYVVTSLTPLSPGDFRNLKAGDDYVGYENDYYLAKKRSVGVHIEFQSAEVVKNQSTSSQSRPSLELFKLPSKTHYIRLVYLVRVSRADHNMAIVAADNPEALDATTRRIQADPDQPCQQGPHLYCSWVPAGIGIQVENPQDIGGRKQ